MDLGELKFDPDTLVTLDDYRETLLRIVGVLVDEAIELETAFEVGAKLSAIFGENRVYDAENLARRALLHRVVAALVNS